MEYEMDILYDCFVVDWNELDIGLISNLLSSNNFWVFDIAKLNDFSDNEHYPSSKYDNDY